jgi:hypothetical protein
MLTLTECVHLSPVDQSVSRHDPISWKVFLVHSELGTTMGLELVQFVKGSIVKQ